MPSPKQYAKLSTLDDDSSSAADDENSSALLCRSFDDSSWFQQTFWGWIWPVVELGSTRQLNAEDLPALPRMMYLSPQVRAIDAAMQSSRFGAECRAAAGIGEAAGGAPPFSCVPDRHLLGVFVRVYWRNQLKFICILIGKESINMAIPMLLRGARDCSSLLKARIAAAGWWTF